jgi:Carboxypeptidase regulatory-like domain
MILLKRIFAMGALYLLLLWPLLLCAQNSGSISGHVTNSITGAAIQGAKVRVCPSAGGIIRCGDTNYQAVTDAAGAFRMGGIPNGQYVVPQMGLAKDGLRPAFAATAGPLPSVTVSGDSRLDLQMTPFAKVGGRVFDPEGKPAAGIAVKLGFLPEKVTSENGEFVFEAVPPQCCLTLSATPKPQPAAKNGRRVVTTYYPSVVDSDQATKVAVMGVDLSYDLRLQTAPARAIRGVVIGADGKPAAGASLTITRTEPRMVSFVRGEPSWLPKQVAGAVPVVTQQDGAFAFPAVLEGEWVVRAFLLHEREIHSGATRVILSSRDTNGRDNHDVEIRLAPPFDLEVTADWGDSLPPKTPPGFALASLIPLDSQIDLETARRPSAEPGEPQRFHLFGGRYLIWEGRTAAFSPVPGFYAAAAMLDGRDVLGQVVELAGSASLKMTYKSGGGSVRGTVEQPASNAVVVLMADATPAARVGYSGRCDANGAFLIPDLPPGEYTAVAVEGPFAGDPLRPEFVAALARDGKRVKVDAGKSAQLELRLALTQ